MIYLDSSVALAFLLSEDRSPPDRLWDDLLVASRLLEYEIWNRLDARKRRGASSVAARALLRQVDLLDMTPDILRRALEPFPVPVRTLDALHLATMDFLRGRGGSILLATYDRRLAAAANALGIDAFDAHTQ